MTIGSQPVDFEQLVLSDDEKRELENVEPACVSFIRPYIGSDGFINGEHSWILALQNATPAQIKSMPYIIKRLQTVTLKRRASPRKATQRLADYPTQFNVTVIPASPFLLIPEVSSEQRQYIPIGYLRPPIIPSNLVRIIENASPYVFGLLTSRMHMAWLRYIGGRLESRYRYSIGLVYNPFPWPNLTPSGTNKVAELARGILTARQKHPDATLADLYDPVTMPQELRKAHHALDQAVDKLYRKDPFLSDRERVELLLARYEAIRAPLLPQPERRKRRRAA